ncbi:MAG: S41 family peptidase, partial [Holophaga sp.]|nr:S41 family peptidase [Holophaga sp.]
AWVLPNLSGKGTRVEKVVAPAEANRPILVDLGQGLRLAYSPWVPMDRDDRTLPHRVTPQPLPLEGEDIALPFSEQSLSNLVVFTRAYGHLRWFQPTDAASQTDWDRAVIAGMAPMAAVKDTTELRERLRTFFGIIAPRAQFLAPGEEPAPLMAPEGTARYQRWVHVGGYELSEKIRPHQGPKRASRLAAVVITWNLLRHFSPYLEPVQKEWEAALEQGLRDAATASDDAAFLHGFRTFTANFRDGHIFPRMESCLQRSFSLPFYVAQAEGRAFVQRVGPNQDPRLTPGSEILSVGGEEANARLARIASEVGPTNLGHQQRGAEIMFIGLPTDQAVSVRWRTPLGEVIEANLNGRKAYVAPRDPKTPVRELESGLWYVDVTRDIPDENETLARLAQAKGLVVDLRGYPSSDFTKKLLSRLIDAPIHNPLMAYPVVRTPEREALNWKSAPGSVVVPKGPRFRAKVAFLIDGEAISYAETLLSMVEAYRLGELVGEPTTGTNGNAASARLPGGVDLNWTGLRVLRHDGSVFHQIGIRPTVPVTRTVKGLKEGRDEALEAAVKAVQQR